MPVNHDILALLMRMGLSGDNLVEVVRLIDGGGGGGGAHHEPGDEFKPSISATIFAIQNATAQYFNISLEYLLSKRRGHSVVVPRHIAFYLARTRTNFSLPEISRQFGRDHTTVLYAVRKIEREQHEKPEIAEAIAAIERALRGDA